MRHENLHRPGTFPVDTSVILIYVISRSDKVPKALT
jgi:hypothetical protein